MSAIGLLGSTDSDSLRIHAAARRAISSPVSYNAHLPSAVSKGVRAGLGPGASRGEVPHVSSARARPDVWGLPAAANLGSQFHRLGLRIRGGATLQASHGESQLSRSERPVLGVVLIAVGFLAHADAS